MENEKPARLLLVDNYDSFTFNLKHLIEAQGNVALSVRRNDEDFRHELERGDYDGAVIGPGPGSPADEAYFGINKSLILDFGRQGLPILGVCLGFQGIYHCFGGGLRLGNRPVHGKTSELDIRRAGTILKDIPQRTRVMRYHSILADESDACPDDIEITSYAFGDAPDANAAIHGDAMSLEHREFPIFGVQFHPESFATRNGDVMIRNFLDVCCMPAGSAVA